MPSAQNPASTGSDTSALQRLARGYLQFSSNVGSAVVGGSLSILLGFSPLPASFPLIAFTNANPTTALIIGAGAIVLIAVAVTVLARGNAGSWFGTRAARFLFSAFLSALGSLAISVTLGFSNLPSSIPLLTLLRTHPPLGIGLVALLLALLIFAPLFSGGGGGSDGPREESASRGISRGLIGATAVSTITAMLFVSLLATVVIRPSWCPTAICPAPILITNPLGIHDSNLEIFYTATQSSTYVIPGDVTQYSLGQNNLPRGTGAVRIDETYPPYRAVIGVHSLQRDPSAGLIIQQVIVVIDSVATPPNPLAIWNQGTTNNFSSNPYHATYRGEPAGSQLIAFSDNDPPTYVDLRAGESDEIDVQLLSTVQAAIAFHIEVVYTVKGDATLHTLDLQKHEFFLDFGAAGDWHVYQIGPDGRFTPASA